MKLEFSRYNNGNLKVTLVVQGCRNYEISRCIEQLPNGVAYIDKEYLDIVKKICGNKARKYNKAGNIYRTAIRFAEAV